MPRSRFTRIRHVALAALCFGLAASPMTAMGNQPRPAPELDVDYVPTPMPTVRRMLEMANAGPADDLVDLGSGDGRILITAARERGVRSAVGIELDPWLVQYATSEAMRAGVSDRVKFIEADLFKTEFADADVVTMYLLPKLNLQLRPYLLARLSPGTRIVSHSFDMGEWEPDARDVLFGKPVYLWIVPAQVAGTWKVELDRKGPPIVLTLKQDFQRVEGQASRDDRPLKLTELHLNGRNIRFRIDGDVFEGRVDGRTMQSTGALDWFAMNR
jgi:hypothetical protein